MPATSRTGLRPKTGARDWIWFSYTGDKKLSTNTYCFPRDTLAVSWHWEQIWLNPGTFSWDARVPTSILKIRPNANPYFIFNGQIIILMFMGYRMMF